MKFQERRFPGYVSWMVNATRQGILPAIHQAPCREGSVQWWLKRAAVTGDGNRRVSAEACTESVMSTPCAQRESGGIPAVPIEGHVTSEEAHRRPGWERWLGRVVHDDAGAEEVVVDVGKAVFDRVVEEGGESRPEFRVQSL